MVVSIIPDPTKAPSTTNIFILAPAKGDPEVWKRCNAVPSKPWAPPAPPLVKGSGVGGTFTLGRVYFPEDTWKDLPLLEMFKCEFTFHTSGDNNKIL